MDTNQMRGGCGGRCACAETPEKTETKTCAPKGEITIDKDGKCPCGKSLNECCHKDEIRANENDAIGEFCASDAGKATC